MTKSHALRQVDSHEQSRRKRRRHASRESRVCTCARSDSVPARFFGVFRSTARSPPCWPSEVRLVRGCTSEFQDMHERCVIQSPLLYTVSSITCLCLPPPLRASRAAPCVRDCALVVRWPAQLADLNVVSISSSSSSYFCRSSTNWCCETSKKRGFREMKTKF